MSRPKDVLAIALSVLVPGAGQLFQGRGRSAALFFGLAFVVVPVVTLVTGVVVLGAGLLVLLPLFTLVWAANVYDAATKWLL
jgi:TM2 domain-containing membrane protein YozV